MDDVTVVVADDDPLWRLVLERAVVDAPGIGLAAVCEDGDAAVAALREHRPDVAVLDREMPGASGIAVARIAAEERLGVRVVLLSASPAAGEEAEGVAAWVQKDAAVPGRVAQLVLETARAAR